MGKTAAYLFEMTFPGDLEYIPAVRKYVADVLGANNFSPKFTYRSEIIVDEICNNAVNFGCVGVNARVKLGCQVDNRRVQFEINDEGGSKSDVNRLAESINTGNTAAARGLQLRPEKQLGLEIVRMISDDLSCELSKNNLTTVRVVKNREVEPEDDLVEQTS